MRKYAGGVLAAYFLPKPLTSRTAALLVTFSLASLVAFRILLGMRTTA